MIPPACPGPTMIVYGDPSYDRQLPELVASLRANLAAPGPSEGAMTLDSVRGWLIAAGQVEQAVEDATLDDIILAHVRGLTDALADAFVACWSNSDVATALEMARAQLDEFAATVPDVTVHVKVPEGFAFYTLYPEQYC